MRFREREDENYCLGNSGPSVEENRDGNTEWSGNAAESERGAANDPEGDGSGHRPDSVRPAQKNGWE